MKKLLIGLGAILFFLVLSYGFMPELLKGKIVNQSDISGYVGMSHEMDSWNKEHPQDPTYWTDSMFGGMPTTAISTRNGGDYTQWLYNLLFVGKRPATYLFVALLGAFLLLLAFGVSWPVAVLGAVAVAFCSYNFQIIQVGHNTKMQAIALMPWVLAALVFTYRGISQGKTRTSRILLGAALFGLALSFQIKANHQQITYYLAIMVLLYALSELIDTIKHPQRWKGFITASLLLLAVGSLGIATNTNKLLPLAKYTPHTMRGGSELSAESGATKGGLDIDYATAWSYGWEELPNLMIPNFNGGASAQAVNPEKSETVKLLKRYGQRNTREVAKALPMYWGPQPFTAGPMYMGAITVFLFVLGLYLSRRKEKWWLLVCSIIAVLMAVGNHFMAFTEFCFKYLPLYNKFRTVSMSLVVLQVALPLLGFITLDRILKKEYSSLRLKRGVLIAFAVTGGFCLLCAVAPGIAGSFTGASDAGMQPALVDALVKDRISLLRADSLLSLALILAAALLLLWAYSPKGRPGIAGIAVCVLAAANLFVTGHRYLNAGHFVTPKDFTKGFAERPVDKIILRDKDPQYRVLDLTASVFNSSVASYRHKSIGGYSPAKLQVYQDLIERHLNREIDGIYDKLNQTQDPEETAAWMASGTPVLNALNTKYIVLDGNYPPLVNDSALGAAWFVEDYVLASSPEEEIGLLSKVILSKTAVLRKEVDPSVTQGPQQASEISLVSYAPNRLVYEYSAEESSLAVFSEIWYPDGWMASVDGKPLELLRANWALRAAVLPAGIHRVEMYFMPQSYRAGAAVSGVSSVLLLLLLAAGCGLYGFRIAQARPSCSAEGQKPEEA